VGTTFVGCIGDVGEAGVEGLEAGVVGALSDGTSVGAGTCALGTTADGTVLDVAVSPGATPFGAVVLVTGSPLSAVWPPELQATWKSSSRRDRA
jgi:hypothetical protein